MRKKKLLLIPLAILLVTSLVACAAPAPAPTTTVTAPAPAPAPAPIPQLKLSAKGVWETPPGVKYVVRYGTGTPMAEPLANSIQLMNLVLYAKTGGRMWVEIYPSSQLGDWQTQFEMFRTGALPYMEMTASKLVMILPWASLFDYPFLFASSEDALRRMHGGILQALNQDLAKNDILFNGFGPTGFHACFMRKGTQPITKVENIKDYKIRVQSPGVYEEAFKAYGAKPVVMPYSEILTAMEQGVIDGFTTTPSAGAIPMGFPDVTAYLSLTDHMINITGTIVSVKFLESLPSDLRDIFLETQNDVHLLKTAKDFQNQESVLAAFAARGSIVNRLSPAAKDGFKARLAPVYDFALKEYGQKILDLWGITKP